LVEICQQAGLPKGVLNLVTGSGSTVGEALACIQMLIRFPLLAQLRLVVE
jgi:delta 1-pyrroline-5-carboxylate dehydrogenase